MIKVTVCCLALIGAAAATPAIAGGFANASVSEITFTVTDLRPGDGQEAYWQSVPSEPGQLPYPYSSFLATAAQGSDESVRLYEFMADGAALSTFGTASATASGTDTFFSASIEFDSLAPTAHSMANASGGAILQLAPYSSLTITGFAQIEAFATDPSISFTVSTTFHLSPGSGATLMDNLSAQGLDTPSFAASAARQLSITWVNNSNRTREANFLYGSGTSIYGAALPVPEPAGYAMMLLGIVTLVGWRRPLSTRSA